MGESTKIFVGSLPQGVKPEELRQLFEDYGSVVECDVMNRCGFVHMENIETATKAIEELNGTDFKGQNIVVELGRPKEPKAKGTPQKSKTRKTPNKRGGPANRGNVARRGRAGATGINRQLHGGGAVRGGMNIAFSPGGFSQQAKQAATLQLAGAIMELLNENPNALMEHGMQDIPEMFDVNEGEFNQIVNNDVAWRGGKRGRGRGSRVERLGGGIEASGSVGGASGRQGGAGGQGAGGRPGGAGGQGAGGRPGGAGGQGAGGKPGGTGEQSAGGKSGGVGAPGVGGKGGAAGGGGGKGSASGGRGGKAGEPGGPGGSGGRGANSGSTRLTGGRTTGAGGPLSVARGIRGGILANKPNGAGGQFADAKGGRGANTGGGRGPLRASGGNPNTANMIAGPIRNNFQQQRNAPYQFSGGSVGNGGGRNLNRASGSQQQIMSNRFESTQLDDDFDNFNNDQIRGFGESLGMSRNFTNNGNNNNQFDDWNGSNNTPQNYMGGFSGNMSNAGLFLSNPGNNTGSGAQDRRGFALPLRSGANQQQQQFQGSSQRACEGNFSSGLSGGFGGGISSSGNDMNSLFSRRTNISSSVNNSGIVRSPRGYNNNASNQNWGNAAAVKRVNPQAVKAYNNAFPPLMASGGHSGMNRNNAPRQNMMSNRRYQ